MTERPLTIAIGALKGARSRLVLDPRAIAHVWALTEGLVVTVSGNLDERELARVARSLTAGR